MKHAALVIWLAIVVLTGTHFRTRDGQSVESLEVDWLIFVQIGVAMVGGFIGARQLFKEKNIGFGAGTLITFIALALLSAAFNPYPTKVIGYWILLAGTALLTMGMIQGADSVDDLKRVEKLWLIVISLIIVKDGITSLFLVQPKIDHEVQRLGIGVTHANEISFLSALAFWLSFRTGKVRYSWLLWGVRMIYLLIMALARTRISMICLLIGGFLWVWFLLGRNRAESLYLRLGSLSLVMAVGSFFILALAAEIPIFENLLETVNRGQTTDKIMSVTGRTDIWAKAVMVIFDDALSFVFGHGYCMSRFVLNEGNLTTFWYAYHAHNAYLEALLSTGFLGFFALMVLLFYGLKWVFNFGSLSEIYTTDFTLRAAIVVSMFVVYSITEADLAMKIGPNVMLFYFYILALDRRRRFL